ncbi:MAG: AAA family ATPase [Candidatus Nitrosotenuis sp.]
MKNKSPLWVDRYAPKRLADIVFQDNTQRAYFQSIVDNKDLPHLLISGIKGTGKSTLSSILIAELGVHELDVLRINSSDETGVDTIREKINQFANVMPFGDFKVVQLEEADYLSPNAQAMLRHIIVENTATTRFIATCNHENRLTLEIKSRFNHIRFKTPNTDAVIELIVDILDKEAIEIDVDVLEKIIYSAYPDIRQIITICQESSRTGILKAPLESESKNYRYDVLELLQNNKFKEARKLLADSVNAEDYEDLFKFLYTSLDLIPKFKESEVKQEKAIVEIADHLYKHGIVADPEINFAALLIKLGSI